MHSNETTPRKPTHDERKQRSLSFRRRLKAAGLADQPVPEDTDEFRYFLARHIDMFVNQWHGCPELVCVRNRGCMTPHGDCTNARSRASDDPATWDRVRFEVRQALNAQLAELGLER